MAKRSSSSESVNAAFVQSIGIDKQPLADVPGTEGREAVLITVRGTMMSGQPFEFTAGLTEDMIRQFSGDLRVNVPTCFG